MNNNQNQNNSSNELLSVMNTVQYEKFYELGNKEHLVSCEPVIIKTVSPGSVSATVSFPSDPTVESSFSYVNRTGRILTTGQKAYLQHKLDDTSQGWIVNNTSVPIFNDTLKVATITTSDSDTTFGDLNIKQYGHVVVFGCSVNRANTASATGWVAVGTVSGITLPSVNVVFPCTWGVSTGGYLTTDGSIILYISTASTGALAWVNFSYIVS